MKTIFEFTDYRQYLSDFYSTKKSEKAGFSYRVIAEKVGFKSAGHFTKILQGKANISIKLIERFADYLKLNKKEAEYFQQLVLFNQSKSHSDRRRHLERALSFKESTITVLNADQYEYYDKWYYTAVRVALSFFRFDGSNYDALAKIAKPAITADEAKKAIELLDKLRLIKKDEEGIFRPTDVRLSTGNETKAVATKNFVINTMDLAKQALEDGSEDLNLSWVTLSLSKDSFQAVQEELRSFRRRLLDIAGNEKNPDRVHHFNFQVFPMTQQPEKI